MIVWLNRCTAGEIEVSFDFRPLEQSHPELSPGRKYSSAKIVAAINRVHAAARSFTRYRKDQYQGDCYFDPSGLSSSKLTKSAVECRSVIQNGRTVPASEIAKNVACLIEAAVGRISGPAR